MTANITDSRYSRKNVNKELIFLGVRFRQKNISVLQKNGRFFISSLSSLFLAFSLTVSDEAVTSCRTRRMRTSISTEPNDLWNEFRISTQLNRFSSPALPAQLLVRADNANLRSSSLERVKLYVKSNQGHMLEMQMFAQNHSTTRLLDGSSSRLKAFWRELYPTIWGRLSKWSGFSWFEASKRKSFWAPQAPSE